MIMAYTIESTVSALNTIKENDLATKLDKVQLIANVSIEKKWTAEALTGDGAGNTFITKVLAKHHGVDAKDVSRSELTKWRTTAHPSVRTEIEPLAQECTARGGRFDDHFNKLAKHLKSEGVSTVEAAAALYDTDLSAAKDRKAVANTPEVLSKALKTKVNGKMFKDAFTEASLKTLVSAIDNLEVNVVESESEPAVSTDIASILGAMSPDKAALIAALLKA